MQTTQNPQNPWTVQDFWRTHGAGSFRVNLKQAEQFEPVLISLIGSQLRVEHKNQSHHATLLGADSNNVKLDIGDRHYHLHHFNHKDELVIHDGSQRSHWHMLQAGAVVADSNAKHDGFIRAPMPGKLVLIKAKPGQSVVKGEELAIMEAMKMELSIKAPCAGKIIECLAHTGAIIDADASILSWEPQHD